MSITFVVEQTESASTRPPATITCAIIRITAVWFPVSTILYPRPGVAPGRHQPLVCVPAPYRAAISAGSGST
jgi:hypothetical protein